MYIVLILIMLQIFHKYIKPIEKTSRIVTELVEGNFRARIHHPANGSIGLLSGQINKLARNLSELSVRGQMKAEQLSTVINNTDNALALIDDKGYIHIVNRKLDRKSTRPNTTHDTTTYTVFSLKTKRCLCARVSGMLTTSILSWS